MQKFSDTLSLSSLSPSLLPTYLKEGKYVKVVFFFLNQILTMILQVSFVIVFVLQVRKLNIGD